MTNKLRKAFKKSQYVKQDKLTADPALLGNSAGTVRVPGRDNYVYVRIAGRPVTEIFNNRVPPVPELPVIVGYDPQEPALWQVLSARNTTYTSRGSAGNSPPHHQQHEWFGDGVNGGSDVVMSRLRQFLPFRIGINSGMTFSVHRGILYANGNDIAEDTVDLDATGAIPSVTGTMRYNLVTVDVGGNIVMTTGSVLPMSSLSLDNIPEPPYNTQYVLGAVRTYYGQTAIRESRLNTDIVDLRFPMRHALPTHIDFPTSYSGSSKQVLRVNETETGVEFSSTVGGGAGDIDYTVDGILVASTEVGGWYIAPRVQTIYNIRAYLDDTGYSGNTIIDVNLNGTSILTASKINIPSNTGTAGYASVTPDILDVAENDVITVDIDSVAERVRGLTVVVSFSPDAADGTKTIHQGIFTATGNIFVGSDPLKLVNALGSDKTISKVWLAVGTSPTGQPIIVDIHKNDITIFTDQGNRPTVQPGNTGGSSIIVNDPIWHPGDYLTLDIDQVGNPVSGADLSVNVVFS